MKKCSRCDAVLNWEKSYCPICGGYTVDVPDIMSGTSRRQAVPEPEWQYVQPPPPPVYDAPRAVQAPPPVYYAPRTVQAPPPVYDAPRAVQAPQPVYDAPRTVQAPPPVYAAPPPVVPAPGELPAPPAADGVRGQGYLSAEMKITEPATTAPRPISPAPEPATLPAPKPGYLMPDPLEPLDPIGMSFGGTQKGWGDRVELTPRAEPEQPDEPVTGEFLRMFPNARLD